MKKFLSLVLALVMTMSLVTISAGAKDFTDNDQVTYTEAVQVMDLLGVINGYSDGSFKPTNTLTRGAAAKIICNLLLTPSVADTLPVNNTGFKDVPTTNTFAKYVAYCANQGIINGYSDGTFKPAGTLTGYAFLKMLLGALGYDPQIEGFTGDTFALNVASKAGELKLTKGNKTFVGTKAVTREEACLYAFNMLNTKTVSYDSKGTEITVNGVTIIQGASPAKQGSYMFRELKFSGLTTGTKTDGFGRKYKTWTYNGSTVKLLTSKADVVYYGKVTAKQIYKDLELASGETYDIVLNDAQTATPMTGKDFYDQVETGTTDALVYGGRSHMVEIYYTAAEDDDDHDTIKIIDVEYKLATVNSPVKANGADDRYITLSPKTADSNLTGAKYVTENFAKGDKVLYTSVVSSDPFEKIQNVQLVKTIEGKVTYAKGDQVTINGSKYATDLNLLPGTSGTYYLGIDNSIIDFSGIAAVSVESVAYVYSVQPVKGTLSEDGVAGADGWKVFYVKADGTKASAMLADSENVDEDDVAVTAGEMVPFIINSDGEFEVADYSTAINGFATTSDIGKSKVQVVESTATNAPKAYMTSATKFVFVDVNETTGKVTVTTTTGYKNVDNQTNKEIAVVYDTETKNALVVFVASAVESEKTYAILADAEPGIGGETGKNTYTYAVVGAGKDVTELVSDTELTFAVGTRFSYVLKDGKITQVQAVTGNYVVEGSIDVKNDDYIVVDNGDAMTLADDCEIFLIDSVTETLVGASDVNAEDEVIVYTNGKTGSDLRVVAIVIEVQA